MSDGQPVLILEDDVDFDSNIFTKEIPLPENADAFYYGISHGDGNYDVEKVCDGLLKGNKIFATHAILHINPEYSKRLLRLVNDGFMKETIRSMLAVHMRYNQTLLFMRLRFHLCIRLIQNSV